MDVGVDFLVVICESGPLNGLEFRVQVKSSSRFRVRDGIIMVPGFRRATLADLVHGFTPALLVLYESETRSGFCFWLNQLLATEPELLSPGLKSVTLRVPMTRPIDSGLWPQLGMEVGGVLRSLSRRVVASGVWLPVLEATHALMQSLHLIDLCAHGRGGSLSGQELVEAELTAHRDIVKTLRQLAEDLREAQSGISGVEGVAKRYHQACRAFAPEFADFVDRGKKGTEYAVNVAEMKTYRLEAARAVTQVVERLSLLSLEGARQIAKERADRYEAPACQGQDVPWDDR